MHVEAADLKSFNVPSLVAFTFIKWCFLLGAVRVAFVAVYVVLNVS